MDYFARHIDSPYMHLWYVAMLLQLELVFPLIYAAFEYMRRQISKNAPMILCVTVAVCSVVYFVFLYIRDGVMSSYYNTLARCFSWLGGISVGYWHVINRTLFIHKIDEKKKSKLILCIFVIIQIALFVIGRAEAGLYMPAMIGTTLFMCVMLDFVKASDISELMEDCPGFIKKVVEYISNISYEIFLVQYPVIFILANLGVSNVKYYVFTVIITLVAAFIINLALNCFKKKLLLKIIGIMFLVVLIVGAVFGGYKYVIAPDLKAEQEALEAEMIRLKEEQEKINLAYEQEQNYNTENQNVNYLVDSILDNHNDIDSQIAAIDIEISRINQMVANLRITFVGDSVLLSASNVLNDYFNKCYIDAEIGRTAYVLDGILQMLDNRRILSNVVVINCGANGDCPDYMKDEIMSTLSGKQVFWVTTSNNPSANASIISYAENYDNLHIIDWGSISEGHAEYFDGDGIHLAYEGKVAYSQAVFDAICNYYIEELEKEKRELETMKNNK